MAPSVKHRPMKHTGEAHAAHGSAVALDELDPLGGRMADANALVGGVGYRLTAKGWEPFRRTARGPEAM